MKNIMKKNIVMMNVNVVALDQEDQEDQEDQGDQGVVQDQQGHKDQEE